MIAGGGTALVREVPARGDASGWTRSWQARPSTSPSCAGAALLSGRRACRLMRRRDPPAAGQTHPGFLKPAGPNFGMAPPRGGRRSPPRACSPPCATASSGTTGSASSSPTSGAGCRRSRRGGSSCGSPTRLSSWASSRSRDPSEPPARASGRGRRRPLRPTQAAPRDPDHPDGLRSSPRAGHGPAGSSRSRSSAAVAIVNGIANALTTPVAPIPLLRPRRPQGPDERDRPELACSSTCRGSSARPWPDS